MAQPRDADAITDGELAVGVRTQRDDFADDLVARYHVGSVNGQIPFGDMQIRAAHAACPHGDQELSAVAGDGTGTVTRSSGRVPIGPGLRTCHALIDVPAVITP